MKRQNFEMSNLEICFFFHQLSYDIINSNVIFNNNNNNNTPMLFLYFHSTVLFKFKDYNMTLDNFDF